MNAFERPETSGGRANNLFRSGLPCAVPHTAVRIVIDKEAATTIDVAVRYLDDGAQGFVNETKLRRVGSLCEIEPCQIVDKVFWPLGIGSSDLDSVLYRYKVA